MEVKIKSSTLSIGIIVVLIGVLGVLLFQMYMPKPNLIGNAVQNVNNNDVFTGKIRSGDVSVGRLEGITTTDKGCYDVGGGLVECNTDISTDSGMFNFIYRHNMAVQPCLSMFGKEKVIVDILDSNGNAKVYRTVDLSSMGGHHG